MAEERKHTNTYSAADIEKYWTGKLTPAEMHAMEKAALDDPFLADAMEGYSRFADGSENIQKDLGALRVDLETRTRPRRNVIMSWWKLAGAAMIVVSLGALAYLLLNRQGESRLAMEQANRQDEKSMPVTKDSVQASVHDTLQQLLPYTPEPTHQTAAPQEVSKAKAPAKIPLRGFQRGPFSTSLIASESSTGCRERVTFMSETLRKRFKLNSSSTSP